MCYGVGVTLTRHFDRAEMIVLPQPSAFSLAAARLAWPLKDVCSGCFENVKIEDLGASPKG